MKTAKAAFWTLAARQADRLLGIVSIVILARLLTPADFGLVALAGSIVALFEVFTAFGFDWAIVRLKDPTREHYDTAWTLRLLLSAAVLVAVLAAAWPLTVYLDDPRILGVMLSLASIAFLASMANIGIAEFRRTMQFDKEFTMQVSAKVAGFLAAVSTALLTRSYWALVIGIFAGRATGVLLSYTMHPFRPRWCLTEHKSLMSFSVWLLVGNIIESARGRLTDVWVGRAFGARSVGLFSMSREIAVLATTEFAAPVNRVAFSRYSQANGDRETLAASFAQFSGAIWAVGLPAAAGIMVCAPEIVATLLGDQWIDATRILQVLALGGMLLVLNANTSYIFWAIDRGAFVCLMAFINLITFVILAWLLMTPYGLLGLAGAEALATLPVLVFSYTYLARWVGVSFGAVLGRNWRVLLATFGMAFGVATIRTDVVVSMVVPVAVKLLILVVSGVLLYVAALLLLWVATGKKEGPEQYFLTLLTSLRERLASRRQGVDSGGMQ